MLRIRKNYMIQSNEEIDLVKEKIEKILSAFLKKKDLRFSINNNSYFIKSKLAIGEQAKGQILTEVLKGLVSAQLSVLQKNDVFEFNIEISLKWQFNISLVVSILSCLIIYFFGVGIFHVMAFFLVMFIGIFCIGLINILNRVESIIEHLIYKISA
ncbi:hypothetical protein [Labilibaculum euxinus]|uniref:Uncharacterized protein n=1 Tax=Labilibaculum euxinus TaxID=2686357 RepID=A0A7M4D1X1_9BACT|nr:hypothetical protein [Labilibaculum euxinus]MUP36650.1 hypothetical protein [Labilibaculum euxinus]MVB05855.1 hypothetical protein [Labilibaculum euxinus]